MSHRILSTSHAPHVNGTTRITAKPNTLTKSDNLLEGLPDEELGKLITERLQHKLTSYSLRFLKVEISKQDKESLVLTGTSYSYHHKQIAFHRLVDVLKELNITKFERFKNDITVL